MQTQHPKLKRSKLYRGLPAGVADHLYPGLSPYALSVIRRDKLPAGFGLARDPNTANYDYYLTYSWSFKQPPSTGVATSHLLLPTRVDDLFLRSSVKAQELLRRREQSDHAKQKQARKTPHKKVSLRQFRRNRREGFRRVQGDVDVSS